MRKITLNTLFFVVIFLISIFSQNKALAQSPEPNACESLDCFNGILIDGGDNMDNFDAQTSCFPADTPIMMADGTTKNIENVKANDKVLSRDEQGNNTSSTVIDTLQPISKNICQIKYTNGDILDVTKGHPLYTRYGWKSIDPAETAKEDPGVPVSRLLVGDFINKVDGSWPQVSSISCQEKSIQTYNLVVDNVHTYFASGFLAHNKGYNFYETIHGQDHYGDPYTYQLLRYVHEWTCFPAGTKVLMENGNQKNIEEINVGDAVVSQSEKGNKSESRVTALDQPIRDHMCQINFEGGEDLKLTDEHPLFTQDGWKSINPKNTFRENPNLKVGKLKEGDQVAKADGATAKVKDFTCWSEKVQTYNLILDNGANTYFADGFLTHNKGGGGGSWAVGAVYNCDAPTWEVDPDNLIVNWCCDARTQQEEWACCTGNACFHPYGEEPCYSPAIAQYQLIYGCKRTCQATPPTITNVTRNSVTSLTVTWTPGQSGTSQGIYIGTNIADVNAYCPDGSTCVVKQDNLPTGQASYTTSADEALSPGTVYFVLVKTYTADQACSADSEIVQHLSSCYSIPSSLAFNPGQPASNLTAGIFGSSRIEGTEFVSADTAVVTVDPAADSTHPYQTNVTPVGLGSTTITSDVYFINHVLACSNTVTVNVNNPDPWWQVKDSDVSSAGDLITKVPFLGGLFFGLAGSGGYPGVSTYGENTDLTASNVSQIGWMAKSSNPSLSSKHYDYSFIARQIPSDVVQTNITGSIENGAAFSAPTTYYGYEWYKYTGPTDLNINGNIDIGDRKIVLMVEGADVYINGNINLTDGVGFFGMFVYGDIFVNPAVGGGAAANIEGIYLSDGNFSTGTGGLENDSQLYIRGSVASYGGLNLQRNLGEALNTENPAEVFEFAPDQILLFPAKLGYRRINWKEVAP